MIADSANTEHFRRDYAAHRAGEGRRLDLATLRTLPYLRSGPLAKQWVVRARTFDVFLHRVVRPLAAELGRPLRTVDLGAGNGWLSYRLACEGHGGTAIDIRDDHVDGLGAARPLLAETGVACHVGNFDVLPLDDGSADLAVFNASLHYATDLAATLAEAARVVRRGGRIAVLDSPFYRSAADGDAMVAEKHATAATRFGDRAESLLALPFIEYLTLDRLLGARPGLQWRRHAVRYPLWYEARPLLAVLRGRRRPSRFDLWVAEVA